MGKITKYDTGATRDTREGKLVYDKFLSPAVLKQFAKYMNMNRVQSDGKLRDGDNWMKGISMEDYMESAFRHFMEFWEYHRHCPCGNRLGHIEGIGAACGLLFNLMGYLHEWLKDYSMVDFDGDEATLEMQERLDKIKEKNLDTSKTPSRKDVDSFEERSGVCLGRYDAEACMGCVNMKLCSFEILLGQGPYKPSGQLPTEVDDETDRIEVGHIPNLTNCNCKKCEEGCS